MVDQRFEAFMRALRAGSSRRTVLTGLGGVTFGGVLSLLGHEPGQAARRRKRRRRQGHAGRGAAGARKSSTVTKTIDFSTHGQGPFQFDFYKKDGVTFSEGSFVGFVQGDEAIIGDIAGTFTPPVSSLSARVAPGFQGTFEFTLTALDASSTVVASESITVTDLGAGGYVTIDLGVLPAKAKYFTLTGVPDAYGTSSITYATTRKSG
jgi:hypothetical protein